MHVLTTMMMTTDHNSRFSIALVTTALSTAVTLYCDHTSPGRTKLEVSVSCSHDAHFAVYTGIRAHRRMLKVAKVPPDRVTFVSWHN